MSSKPLTRILGTRLIANKQDPIQHHDISLSPSGTISSITPHNPNQPHQESPHTLNAHSSLLAPSLCTPHIHLDKPHLFSHPTYTSLLPQHGTFPEALSLTSTAKHRFTPSDLLQRGRWLLQESLEAGVTHLRAFVEVDHIVRFMCLDAALELKREFAAAMEVQVCVFAQEPIFSGENGEENRRLLHEALQRPEVEVLGTTPYVESPLPDAGRRNVEWAVQMAWACGKHVDFHIDYHLDPSVPAMTPYVLAQAAERGWTRERTRRTIVLGHCTRLTLFSKAEWLDLAREIKALDLPVYFIGLPTSDLFIQGAPSSDAGGGERPRATLQIPQMVREYGIRGAIGINNVGNAFTPQGSADPLALACLGVGVYQVGSEEGVRVLWECVSGGAREAIGLEGGGVRVGAEGSFVVFEGVGGDGGEKTEKRGRGGLREMVWDPPRDRRTVFRGRLVEM